MLKQGLRNKANQKGFTLAELLVIVAIIAILVVISISIFTGQLEKTKAATDEANVRAAKAAAVTAVLCEDKNALNYENGYWKGFYDAENGKMISKATDFTPYKGYNQIKQNNLSAKTACIRVVIKDNNGTWNIETKWENPFNQKRFFPIISGFSGRRLRGKNQD